MSTDPRGHVRPGQTLALAASQVNWINEQMRKGGVGTTPGKDFRSPYTWVYAKNNTGSNLARWGVMAITGVEVTPTANDDDAATVQYCTMPVLTGGAPADVVEKWCVAIEPIESGKIGRVAVDGAVQVRKVDLPKLAGATVLWKDDNWALVRPGDNAIRLGKTQTDWNVDSTCEIELFKYNHFPNETSADPAGNEAVQKIFAVNRTKRLVKANRWVLIGRAMKTSDTDPFWYLIEERNANCDYPHFSLNGQDLTTNHYAAGGSTDNIDRGGGPVHALFLKDDCLDWVAAQEICVVTNASLTQYGLELTRTKVWAFVSTSTCETVTIPTITCNSSSS